MAKLLHGGRLVARALKREGVQYLFTVTGGHIAPILDGCLDEGIKLMDARHEQSAVHMADGWARATGQPGIAALTAGPGVTDGVTGVANAWQSASPVIVLGGQVPLAQYEMGPLQEMDHLSVMRPLVKWATACYQTHRLPEYIAMAYRHAAGGRPGPVYLELPTDVLSSQVDEDSVPWPEGYRTTARPHGDPALVRQAVDLLARAQRPVVLAGSGAWWSGAGPELQQFIEAAGLPLVLAEMGRGVVREDHRLCFGPNRVGVRQADVVLVLGTRFNYQLNFGRPPMFAEDVKIVQVDIEPREIGRNRSVALGIVGDARSVLRQMNQELQGRGASSGHADWVKECRSYLQRRREEMQPELASDNVPIHPLRLCHEIAGFLPKDATIVVDGGDISTFGAQVLRVNWPGHWMDNGPFGCLGPGFGFALAAKLARPQEPVLLLNGDGAFGLNAMEMDTAVRHRLPIVCVVGNDGRWGMGRQARWATYGKERGDALATDIGVRPYHKMVEGLGGYGEFVERPEDIRPALERAFASGLPACLNVATDPEAFPGGRRRGT